MIHILIIYSLFALIRNQPHNRCNDDNKFYYNGACLLKTCLTEIASRIRMTPLDQWTTQSDKLKQSITYQTIALESPDGYVY